ncbi:MAG TPA: cbb3-type cytochrome oxidase assembly protein CcoS [Chiayiivirga sp.]|nr:cbb3-type cytochrome oxidase assembly protein CcoS [Chiayiivirga sp.]
MSILILMIPLSLLFVLGAGAAFFWAVNHDQFDDMESPGLLPLSEPAVVPEASAHSDTTDAMVTAAADDTAFAVAAPTRTPAKTIPCDPS